eukprot:3938493-Rhodomonas_salina.1
MSLAHCRPCIRAKPHTHTHKYAHRNTRIRVPAPARRYSWADGACAHQNEDTRGLRQSTNQGRGQHVSRQPCSSSHPGRSARRYVSTAHCIGRA